MSTCFARRSLTSLALLAVVVLLPASVRTQRGTGSADARLRALYTEEWNWRQQEMARVDDQYTGAGGSDRLPRVDDSSQQARLAYWTKALTTLDGIPFEELSAEEKVNAQVFHQRHFHDAILAIGSVPLPVLEQRMAQFVADGR